MPSFARTASEVTRWQPPAWQDDLRCRALAGVLRGVQEGELPLFAWTLGLAQDEFMAVLSTNFPDAGHLEPLLAPHYERLLSLAPDHFHAMVALLTEHHTGPDGDPLPWLPRVVAAACFGERHLWQDLGLADRGQVRTLLLTEFPSLGLRNTQGLRWKRFLFKELGTRLGCPDLLPPGCWQCDSKAHCHPN